jgi:hypothetical protein
MGEGIGVSRDLLITTRRFVGSFDEPVRPRSREGTRRRKLGQPRSADSPSPAGSLLAGVVRQPPLLGVALYEDPSMIGAAIGLADMMLWQGCSTLALRAYDALDGAARR